MPEEIFDVVDEQDRVIGRATRGEVHAQKLLHRAVHVFVFNDAYELLLQMRSANKDEFPLTYTSSCSGHVDSGETYDEAARREMQEELGLECALERLHKFPATEETAREHTVLYQAATDAVPNIDPFEIDFVRYCSLAIVREMLLHEHERFSPPFVALLEWFFDNMPGTAGS